MVLIAHLSDAHIGPLPRVRVRELIGKRLTGYVNWRRGRNLTHDMGMLDAMLADIAAQRPDHIAFTGDVINIGLTSEISAAGDFMGRLGPPDRVSFVPGNHDIYVRGSLRPLGLSLGPWMTGDDERASAFPYVRRRDGIAFIGLSSAVPTLPFLASGTLGAAQLSKFEALLASLRDEGLCRVVLIHHPPYRGGTKAGRELTDAARFEAAIRRAGAELILHGHNHRISLVHLAGPDGPVPVLGAPSASATGGSNNHRPGYFTIAIEPAGTRSRIAIATRGPLADGTGIGRLGEIPLVGARAG